MSPVFPFSGSDIDLAQRAETEFEITDFDATTAPYHVHNDHSQMATGLTEGFHVLRSRAFVGRDDGASIFHTATQVFYYDTQPPAGAVAFPAEGDQLGGSSYGAVVLTDASVSQVWYYIDDSDPTNDNPVTGNGVNNWKLASAVTVPTNLGSTGYGKEWRFTYSNIPATGNANIIVRLKEASSSSDMGLDDILGHFTTLTRNVVTGSPVNFRIIQPATSGETVGTNVVLKVYFKKELIGGMTNSQFLEEFSIYISSSVSGDPDNPVFQPRSGYQVVRNVNSTEHSVEFRFPNLYNGMPNFLHTVRVEHDRGSLHLSDSTLVKMRVDDAIDSDGDGLPNWWELLHGLQANNPTGRHGAGGDFDLDGVSNLEEYLYGMNPAVADGFNFPRITMTPHLTTPGAWTLGFPTIPNRRYQWQASTTLANDWLNFGSPVQTVGATTPGITTKDDNGFLPRRFFRMNVSPAP